MSAGDDWLFKASLLVTVTKLIEAIKEQSSTLGAITVPLVRESLAPIVCHKLTLPCVVIDGAFSPSFISTMTG
jgi:hypothetical protein